MDKHIIQTLVDTYASMGINLTKLVDSPLFASLTLSEKVKLLKDNADAIHADIHKDVYKPDIKSALKNSALASSAAGVMVSMGALQHIHSNLPVDASFKDLWDRIPAKNIARVIAMAGLASAGVAAVNEYSNYKNKQKLNAEADALVNNKTDSGALQFLINKGPIKVTDNRLQNNILKKLNAVAEMGYVPTPTESALQRGTNLATQMDN